MLSNYIKISLRNLRKHKIYTFINIFGLSLGLACSMLILIYVLREASYDRFHVNGDRIYRVGREITTAEGEVREPVTPVPLAPALLQEFPDLETAFRIRNMGKTIVRYDDHKFYENHLYYADPAIFQTLTLTMLRGDANTALNQPYSIVITKEMAEKYFGDKDPIGKSLFLNNQHDFLVTGLLADLPKTTSIYINMLCSFSTLNANSAADLNDWQAFSCQTFVMFKPGADPQKLTEQFPAFIDRHVKEKTEGIQGTLGFYLNSLQKLYLYSHLDGMSPGLITKLVSYSILAIFIALIACINFMNLSTARSATRAKEIGLRKVIGANRQELIRQLIMEAIVISVFALIVALILVKLALPVFSANVDQELSMDFRQSPLLILAFLGLTIIVGLFAGFYPAVSLSRLQPVDALNKNRMFKRRKINPRSVLVVIQFLLSSALISQTYFMGSEIRYLENKDIGFDKQNVITLPILDDEMRSTLKSFKTELRKDRSVINIASISATPGWGVPRNVKIPEGYSHDDMQLMEEVHVDADFLPTIGLKLVSGRNFSELNPTDQKDALIINELAAKKFGWDEPLGKTIQYSVGDKKYKTGVVVGMVKDFHITSLHRIIEPLFVSNQIENVNHMLIRIEPGQTTQALAAIRHTWESFYPNQPFEYGFLANSYDWYFRILDKVYAVMIFFATLGIALACMGIFALATFLAERKTKEIGIRKVLGDSTMGIMMRINYDMIKYVLIAWLFLFPYLYFTSFGEGPTMFFPYWGVNGSWIHIKTFILVFAISIVSVSYQAIRAATANPIESLRYE
ncbi:ABC transporter permease [candidate division KSB1 bacterium]|nr:ABC transporter permease [candidate division KSB1 bacterium]